MGRPISKRTKETAARPADAKSQRMFNPQPEPPGDFNPQPEPPGNSRRRPAKRSPKRKPQPGPR